MHSFAFSSFSILFAFFFLLVVVVVILSSILLLLLLVLSLDCFHLFISFPVSSFLSTLFVYLAGIYVYHIVKYTNKQKRNKYKLIINNKTTATYRRYKTFYVASVLGSLGFGRAGCYSLLEYILDEKIST